MNHRRELVEGVGCVPFYLGDFDLLMPMKPESIKSEAYRARDELGIDVNPFYTCLHASDDLPSYVLVMQERGTGQAVNHFLDLANHLQICRSHVVALASMLHGDRQSFLPRNRIN